MAGNSSAMEGSGAYSITDYFAGAGGVFITGSSGYVGSLVLEKLLRSTDVERVYVLLRAKKDEDIQARLDSMLNKNPLMHLLRGNPVLGKVRAVAGNMLLPGLGISADDRATLQRDVQTVIHCAADIRLEVGIQDLLRANYEGTRQLLNMARSFSDLRAFVHVSSAYTNMNAPQGSLVKEAIYPLSYGDQPVDDHELVQELLDMPPHNANLRAEGLLSQWNFPNNYTLSKHLAEYMLADYQAHLHMPIAIVRPTLISSVARDPYPGFTGNFAGHVGATLAFMAGLFNSPHASLYKASNVWDVIPADVVGNIILATAAAVGQGAANACVVTPTRSGRVIPGVTTSHTAPPAADAMPRLPDRRAAAGAKGGPLQLHAYAGAAAARRAAEAADASAGGRHAHSPDQLPKSQQQQQSQQQGLGEPAEPREQQLLIVHCGSSTIYPLTIMESWNWGVEVYGAWQGVPNLVMGKCAGPMSADHEPDARKAAFFMGITSWKIWAAAAALSWFNMERTAKKLSVGWESFKIINQPKTDVNLRFSTSNMQRLVALLDPAERDEFLLLWKPQASRSRLAAAASDAGAARSALVPGAAPRYGLMAAAADGSAGKLAAAGGLLADDTAQHHDLDVIKAAADIGSRRGLALGSDSTASPCSFSDDLLSSEGECDTGCGSAASSSSPRSAKAHGAALSPEAQEEVRRMRSIPVEWRAFHIHLGAFLYCTQFKMPVPAPALPITKPEVMRWLNIKPADRVITHEFKLYK